MKIKVIGIRVFFKKFNFLIRVKSCQLPADVFFLFNRFLKLAISLFKRSLRELLVDARIGFVLRHLLFQLIILFFVVLSFVLDLAES